MRLEVQFVTSLMHVCDAQNGSSLLNLAACKGNVQMVQFLLDLGLEADSTNEVRLSLFHRVL
jgi:hypothetical protein